MVLWSHESTLWKSHFALRMEEWNGLTPQKLIGWVNGFPPISDCFWGNQLYFYSSQQFCPLHGQTFCVCLQSYILQTICLASDMHFMPLWGPKSICTQRNPWYRCQAMFLRRSNTCSSARHNFGRPYLETKHPSLASMSTAGGMCPTSNRTPISQLQSCLVPTQLITGMMAGSCPV